MNIEIGKEIGRRMKALGLDEMDLAVKMRAFGQQVGFSTVRAWLMSGANPRAEYLPAISSVLGCSIDDLCVSAEDCVPTPTTAEG